MAPISQTSDAAQRRVRTGSDPVQAWEWCLLAAFTVIGFGVRFWRIHECGLSHFDAGIYAQSGLYPWTGSFHFQQGYFSPPLYPLLVGAANLAFGGPTDWSGVLVSALAGSLLIPLGWWICRAWWCPSAGIVGASLVSLDGLQIVFSRVGLTDALFTLLFIAAIAACRSAILSGGWLRLALGGLLVGLAWNTKYNGFLPVVLVSGYLFDRDWLLASKRIAVISVASLALYLPWAYWFHVKHGYGTLVSHQKGYLAEPANVLSNIGIACEQMNTASIPALWIGMYVVSVVLIFRRHLLAAFIVALLACLVAVLESSFWSPLTWLTLAGIGIAGLPMVRDRIGGAVMLSLLLLIPALYTPYLRLWLPTEAFLTLFVAGGVATGANWLSLIGNRVRGRNWILTGAALALVAGLVNVTTVMRSERFRFWREAGWQPRTGYRETATAIQQSIAEPNKAYTMCRWPLNYYLFVAGVPIRPLAGEPWSSAIMSDYDRLLVDRAIQDTPAFQPTFERAKDRLRWETSELTDPDLPTLIDDFEWRSNFDVLLLPSEKQTVSFHEFARESPTNYRTWIFRK